MRPTDPPPYGLIGSLWLSSASASLQLFSAISFAGLILDAKTFLYMASLGAFVVGVGLGMGWENKKKRTTQREMRASTELFANLQFRLSAGATLGLPVAILFWIGIDYARRTYAWVPVQVEFLALAGWVGLVALWLGWSTGRYLPIVSSFFKKTNAVTESFLFLFGLDFVGCFLGAVLFLIWLYPSYGLIGTLALAGMISAAGYFSTLFFLERAPRHKLIVQVAFAGVAVWAFSQRDWLEITMDNLLFQF